MNELESPSTRPFSVLEIRRAISHHRRAIEALHDRSSFQGIHEKTAARLIQTLEGDLRKLEDELGRRRLGEIRRLEAPLVDSPMPDTDPRHYLPSPVRDPGHALTEAHFHVSAPDRRNNTPFSGPSKGV